MLTGNTGVGKSYTAVDMGMAIATGSQWMGVDTQQSHVVLIDEQHGNRRMWKRMHDAGIRYNQQEVEGKFMYLSNSHLNLAKDGLQRLTALKDWAPGLIIFDALEDMTRGYGVDSQEVRNVVDDLRQFAYATGVTVLLLADQPFRNYDYIHIYRDAFEEAHDVARFELFRDEYIHLEFEFRMHFTGGVFHLEPLHKEDTPLH